MSRVSHYMAESLESRITRLISPTWRHGHIDLEEAEYDIGLMQEILQESWPEIKALIELRQKAESQPVLKAL